MFNLKTTPTHERTSAFLIWAITAIYLTLQIYQHLLVKNAITVSDSVDYLAPAKTLTLSQLFLWPYSKLWGAALFYHFTGQSLQIIDLTQILFSALAWITLGSILSKFIFNQTLKVISFALILIFSLSTQVQLWNHVVLSESLSISLMVLEIALSLKLILKWDWKIFSLLALVILLWVNTREANLFLGIFIGLFILVISLFAPKFRKYLIISFLVLFAWGINARRADYFPQISARPFSVTNIILIRVLPNHRYVQFFKDHGMPANKDLFRLQGQYAYADNFAIFNHPDFRKFQTWLYKKGEKTYFKFMLTYPSYTFLGPIQNIPLMMTGRLPISFQQAFSGTLRKSLNEFIFPVRYFSIYFFLCAVLFFLTLYIKLWKNTNAFWMITAILVLWIPHIFLAWLGDSMEVSRHAIQANIQFRLGMLMLFSIFLDSLIQKISFQKSYKIGFNTTH